MQRFINKIILDAGKKLLKMYDNKYQIMYKNPRDLVTEADKSIEKYIKTEILKEFPHHQIIAEESDTQNIENKDHIWYIDPIDGTTNFVHKFPCFSISIAYENKQQLSNASIYSPVLKEYYYAVKGKGAFKNNKRIYVSQQNKLINALATTGFACIRAGLKQNNLKHFNKIVPQIRGIRRTGSATYDLCTVASGVVDAYWEMELHAYDIMAGKLIVEEAGGRVSDFSGKDQFPKKKEILATNGTALHAQFIKLLQS